MTQTPEFIAELPAKARAGRPSAHSDFIEELRKNPGAWAKSPYENRATSYAWARRNGLDSARRGDSNYVRYPAAADGAPS